MKEIPLTQGKVVLVDDEDYDFLNQWKWHALKSRDTFYAARGVYSKHGIIQIRMHRLLLNAPADMEVDHRDGNGLNNTRRNIRLCTAQANRCNERKRANKTSQYKGVSWHKKDRRWHARIQLNGILKYLGGFHTQEEAALIYNMAAATLFGEFARLNWLRERSKGGDSGS